MWLLRPRNAGVNSEAGSVISYAVPAEGKASGVQAGGQRVCLMSLKTLSTNTLRVRGGGTLMLVIDIIFGELPAFNGTSRQQQQKKRKVGGGGSLEGVFGDSASYPVISALASALYNVNWFVYAIVDSRERH